MFKVYLAGPITGFTFGEATNWRETASSMLEEFGVKGLSPMRNTRYRESEVLCGLPGTYDSKGPLSSSRGIMTRDRYDATRCDALLVNLLGAQRVSIGTCMEIAWADLKRIPIIVAMEEVGNPHEHAMISEAIGFRTSSLKEALNVTLSVLGV